jgi:hypothetical protein
MEIGKAVYKLLKDSADVGAICADRIYPEMAQQDVDVPFIVYTVIDTTPSGTKNATSKLDTGRVELYCISDDYEQAMNLGIAVRSALDRQSGTISAVEVQSIDFDTSDIQFDPDQRVYVLEQTYDVRIQRTGTAQVVSQFPGNVFTVEEVDGDPSGAVNKLVFSNGSVSITDRTATVTTGGNVDSVNTQTGDVVLDADDISDATTTNKFATQAQLDKVDHLTVTQAVNLDTIESDTATNNAKVGYTDAAVDTRIAAASITDLSDTPATLGTNGQVLAVNSGGTALEFVDQSTVSVQYHGRYDTEAETKRSGATATLEVYYTARPDGDGFAESEVSDVGETDTINRTLFYSTKYLANPDTAGDWTQYTTQPADNATFATAKAALLAGLNETDATAETRGTLPLSLKMVRTTTAAVTNLLLDDYPNAAAAYSVRKLDKDYVGSCMRIRRASDDAETDIGFYGNGDLDTSAISTHGGASACFVTTWYDQSGNSNNATQSTAGNQPQIYNGTAVITVNGKPAARFDGTSSRMANTAAVTQANTFVMVNTWPTQDGNLQVMLDGINTTGGRQGYGIDSDLGVRLFADAGNWGTDPMTAGDQTLGLGIFNGTSSTLRLNGSAVSGITAGTQDADGQNLGSTFNGALNADMDLQEFIMWDSDQSTPTDNRSGIETDLNSYFSIF